MGLRIFEGEEALNDITFSYKANFFLFATLESARPIAQGRVPQTSAAFPVLTGMFVSGMAYLDRPIPAGYFLFPDLSVRHEGKYRLSFNLYEETKDLNDMDAHPSENSRLGRNRVRTAGSHAPTWFVDWRLEVKSKPFTVFSAKKFPGLAESTSLSRIVAEQGCRVRIRRDVRMRRRDHKPAADIDAVPNEDDVDDDEPEFEDDAPAVRPGAAVEQIAPVNIPAAASIPAPRAPPTPSPESHGSSAVSASASAADAAQAQAQHHQHYHQQHQQQQQQQQHHHQQHKQHNLQPQSQQSQQQQQQQHQQQQQQQAQYQQYNNPLLAVRDMPAPSSTPAPYGAEPRRRTSGQDGAAYGPSAYSGTYSSAPAVSTHPQQVQYAQHSYAVAPPPPSPLPPPPSYSTMSYIQTGSNGRVSHNGYPTSQTSHETLDTAPKSRRLSMSNQQPAPPLPSSLNNMPMNSSYSYHDSGLGRPPSVVGRTPYGAPPQSQPPAVAPPAPRTPTPTSVLADHPLPPLNVAIPGDPRYRTMPSSATPASASFVAPPPLLPVASGSDPASMMPPPPSARPAVTSSSDIMRATKRPYGAAFDSSQLNASLRDGMRPSEDSVGNDTLIPDDDEDADSVFDAQEMLRLRMQYKRADGTEISRRPPSTS